MVLMCCVVRGRLAESLLYCTTGDDLDKGRELRKHAVGYASDRRFTALDEEFAGFSNYVSLYVVGPWYDDVHVVAITIAYPEGPAGLGAAACPRSMGPMHTQAAGASKLPQCRASRQQDESHTATSPAKTGATVADAHDAGDAVHPLAPEHPSRLGP